VPELSVYFMPDMYKAKTFILSCKLYAYAPQYASSIKFKMQLAALVPQQMLTNLQAKMIQA
jgi:hypothetical protein